MAHEIVLPTQRGYPGDPLQQLIEEIRAALTVIGNAVTSGTATILQTATTVVVTHGLDYTPTAANIQITPIEDYVAGVRFWVHTFTATQFTIEINAAASADADFVWRAYNLGIAS